MAGLVVLFAVVSRRFDRQHRLNWALGPFLAVVAVTVIDLLTHDKGVPAQIFFLLPVLYGASQLRPPGAALLTAASVAGEVTLVVAQLPVREAIVDAIYVTAALVTCATLLGIANASQAQTVDRLRQAAAVDALTGLKTRRVFDNAASNALARTRGGNGTALVLIDVDHFKTINDVHGHPVGDEVLMRLATLLLERCRPRDVACRLGGDEIAILMPGCRLSVAEARAEEFGAAVQENSFAVDGAGELDVSISVGCAHHPTHGADLQTLYAAADAVLYNAKQSGRGRVGRLDARATVARTGETPYAE